MQSTNLEQGLLIVRVLPWTSVCCILLTLVIDIYREDHALSNHIKNDMMYLCQKRSHIILNPWLVRLDSLGENMRDVLFLELSNMDQNMAAVATNRHQYDLAEGNCQRSLAYVKRIKLEGPKKN
jgi:hypothetical protein